MSRTNSEELALLVLRLVKAVDADLNTTPASDLVTQCGEARELALKVLADHVVQEFVTRPVELDIENLKAHVWVARNMKTLEPGTKGGPGDDHPHESGCEPDAAGLYHCRCGV